VSANDGGHHGSLRLYLGVFVALLVLTALTVWSAFQPLGALHTPVALGIAGTKAMLVILYFMHVRWSSRLTWVFASSGFLFLVILLVFTLADFRTREWLPLYG
jgi:cytochrome c oxidase subunit 4